MSLLKTVYGPRGRFFPDTRDLLNFLDARDFNPTFSTTPRINVYDNESQILIHAEVPGMKKEDIKIDLDAETISISGEKSYETPEGASECRKEFDKFSFKRTITFPVSINPEKVAATLEDGILEIKAEKSPNVQTRTISIK